MIMRVCSMVGPALNLLMVAMPHFTIGKHLKFDNLSWCPSGHTLLLPFTSETSLFKSNACVDTCVNVCLCVCTGVDTS
jgi:hypothetical protein